MSRPGDYDAVRKDIIAQLKKPDYDDGSAGPVFVRLAWFVFFPSFPARSPLTLLLYQALRRHI
jgi:hypothetical protein